MTSHQVVDDAPLGYIFSPEPDELIQYYLQPKMLNQPAYMDIEEREIYNNDPRSSPEIYGHWIMYEYQINHNNPVFVQQISAPSPAIAHNNKIKEIVLCHIHIKASAAKKKNENSKARIDDDQNVMVLQAAPEIYHQDDFNVQAPSSLNSNLAEAVRITNAQEKEDALQKYCREVENCLFGDDDDQTEDGLEELVQKLENCMVAAADDDDVHAQEDRNPADPVNGCKVNDWSLINDDLNGIPLAPMLLYNEHQPDNNNEDLLDFTLMDFDLVELEEDKNQQLSRTQKRTRNNTEENDQAANKRTKY